MMGTVQRGSLAIGAAADVLGVSSHTVRRMLADGELEGYRLKHSGHRRIHVESLRRYIGNDETLLGRLESKLAKPIN